MKKELTIQGKKYEVEQVVIDHIRKRTEERLGDYIRQLEGQLAVFKSRNNAGMRHVVKLMDGSVVEISSEAAKKLTAAIDDYIATGKKTLITVRGSRFMIHQVVSIIPYRQHLQDQGMDGATIETAVKLSGLNAKPDNLRIEQAPANMQLGGGNAHE